MVAKYSEFQQLNLPAIEKDILSVWEQEQAFEKSVSLRDGAVPFVFYEGPPSANGMPGIHHVISRTLKDMVCRYKTMQGFQVTRKGGWDTHGLPIELGVEKELGITKEDIGKKISVEAYNQKCREAVLRYKDKWDELTTKMGYWVDLKNPYITFENNYIEALWWILKNFYNKGLLYESVSIQPYSPAAGTGLSSHELNQPGTYKDVKDTSAVAMFKVEADALPAKGASLGASHPLNNLGDPETYFLAWTTTPWTLPSNLGLAVGPKIEYTAVRTFNPYTLLPVTIIMATSLLSKFYDLNEDSQDLSYLENESLQQEVKAWLLNGDRSFPTTNPATDPAFMEAVQKKKHHPFKIVTTFSGKDLEGVRYQQLLPFEANSLKEVTAITPQADPFRIVLGDFVTTEDGTGIVHIAPAFGADDYKVGQKNNLGILVMVDKQGKFLDGLGPYSNHYVKNYKDDPHYEDVNVTICIDLKVNNHAYKVEKYEHSYPHCWRTDKPILYYPLDAWFIRTTAMKDKMVELNKTINWKPASTGTGRFGNWLENMVDWNLSRSRFWGTPLPIWRTEDGTEEICIGTIEELYTEIEKATAAGIANDFNREETELDLHKPYVDKIILVSPSGKKMQRVPDLIDVWFDSGAMPYAQWGLDYDKLKAGDPRPFKAPFDHNYPADFIAEGVDQTRGWFYTLHAISSLLYENVAYKTCVSNGLVLDKAGNKMSKRVGNVIDPFETINNYGADATRWYLITNASPWDSMKFDTEGIKEVQRKFFGTIYNTYQFFALYANVDGFKFKEAYIPLQERPEIDQWIISSLNTLIGDVTKNLDDYEPTQAGRLIEVFVDEHLSNWYVRLCRRRFWKGDYELNKISAYQTLYECLETLSLLIAPVSPFFAEWLFTNLNKVSHHLPFASVHHANYPVQQANAVQQELEERMRLAQDITSLVFSLRKKENIKVRQPLQKILIPVLDPAMQEHISKVEALVKSEVNVKEIQYITETNGFIKKKIKPNFAVLGKRVGAKMKAVSAVLAAMTQEEIAKIEKEGEYSFLIEGEPLILQNKEVEITSEDIPGWIVASKDALTVALDVTITPELVNEGNARELVNRIQKIRKDNGYEVTDRIIVSVFGNERVNNAINSFNTYIAAEILADKLEVNEAISGGIEIDINDVPIKLLVTKKE